VTATGLPPAAAHADGGADTAAAAARVVPPRRRAAVPVIPRPSRAGSAAPPDAELDVACSSAADGLLAQQRPNGHWSYRLESNVCMEAEYVMLGRILGRLDEGRAQRIVARILAEQQPDGGWAVYAGGPSDADCTVEAYVALRAAGLGPGHPACVAAHGRITALGGLAATRVFTRMWLACCGLHPWEPLPELPPELLFLPTRAPLSLPRFASWARATIVPLTVVLTLRPATASIVLGARELPAGAAPDGPRRNSPRGAIATGFRGVDAMLHAYRRSPWQPGRARALRAAEAWILEHQEADGGIGGIQPPMAYQCLALHALGYRAGNPALDRAWNAFEGFILEDDSQCEVQACLSPVWDTGLAMLALSDLGLPRDHPALLRAASWLLQRECVAVGDWAAMRPRLPAGGWPFEYDNQLYPDVDDTAIVLLALQRVEMPQATEAVRRGLRWMLGMQSRDGGFGAFDADNTGKLVGRIPFCDFGAVTDPPSADVTAHVAEACAVWGLAPSYTPLRRSVAWLLRAQEADGAWFGRWGVNYVYGTAAAIPGLVAGGMHRTHPAVQAGLDFLLSVQHDDGSFGEDCASYDDPALRGRGDATPSQTAWGLQGLCSAGEARSGAAARAARWLLDMQGADGLWRDHRFTGTGFPRDFYLRYHGYAAYFPAAALGRYRRMRPPVGARQATGVPMKLAKALAENN
jgi:squalene-hopene/tetraprenyl-beta-curcumene cyclase